MGCCPFDVFTRGVLDSIRPLSVLLAFILPGASLADSLAGQGAETLAGASGFDKVRSGRIIRLIPRNNLRFPCCLSASDIWLILQCSHSQYVDCSCVAGVGVRPGGGVRVRTPRPDGPSVPTAGDRRGLARLTSPDRATGRRARPGERSDSFARSPGRGRESRTAFAQPPGKPPGMKKKPPRRTNGRFLRLRPETRPPCQPRARDKPETR